MPITGTIAPPWLSLSFNSPSCASRPTKFGKLAVELRPPVGRRTSRSSSAFRHRMPSNWLERKSQYFLLASKAGSSQSRSRTGISRDFPLLTCVQYAAVHSSLTHFDSIEAGDRNSSAMPHSRRSEEHTSELQS